MKKIKSPDWRVCVAVWRPAGWKGVQYIPILYHPVNSVLPELPVISLCVHQQMSITSHNIHTKSLHNLINETYIFWLYAHIICKSKSAKINWEILWLWLTVPENGECNAMSFYIFRIFICDASKFCERGYQLVNDKLLTISNPLFLTSLFYLLSASIEWKQMIVVLIVKCDTIDDHLP